jgi:hypothetical protein
VTYSFFWRGQTIYWNEDSEIVAESHRQAIDATRRGFPMPEAIQYSDQHPSRIGYAWRLNGPQDVG